MLKNGTILMIKEMALKGKSAYAISKALDISKATVAKYMAEPIKCSTYYYASARFRRSSQVTFLDKCKNCPPQKQ